MPTHDWVQLSWPLLGNALPDAHDAHVADPVRLDVVESGSVPVGPAAQGDGDFVDKDGLRLRDVQLPYACNTRSTS
jgi:hypothetical protein